MRTCSKEVKAKLMRRDAPPLHPGWVLTAYWDALNNRPMSLKREKELCKAMGLNSRPPRRFYRPCLSVELGEAIRKYDIDVEAMLWMFVKWEIASAEVEANPDAYEHGYAVELEL